MAAIDPWALSTAARTMWQECRGEPLEGREAVAHVIKNRLETGRWGPSLASVCLWRGQFSGWYMPHDPNFEGACNLGEGAPALTAMRALIQGAMSGEPDPTGGATHYYADTIPAPAWVEGATFCCQIGHHRFYKDVK